MRILIIGSGGREHALCWALRKTSTRPLELFCAPGNAGIAEIGQCVSIPANDYNRLAEFAAESEIDVTMVGPEVPLAEGIVDLFTDRGLRIVGPTRAAAQLEASKAFAKDFMRRHSIPTALYQTATSDDEAADILKSGKFGGDDSPVVIKADGLAAGKGVYVAANRAAAFAALEELAAGAVGTEAARRIVVEEALQGPEVSLLLFSDGKDFRLMPAARDHKRVWNNDTGPNTGGMGSITGSSVLDDEVRDRIVREVVEPSLQGCAADGISFRGVLFIGLMLTAEGPRVLEYNVRFGDPETQAILVRLRTDLAEVFQAITEQRLGEMPIDWSPEASACVVLASRGYPAKPETGAQIHGLDTAGQRQAVTVFHAATSRGPDNEWLTAGGRVLGITASGHTLDAALARCYGAVAEIHWEGMHYRTDIGREPRRAALP